MVIVAGHINVEPQERESYVAGCVSVVEQARGAAGCLDFAITADLVDVGPLAQTRQPITDAIAGLTPLNGTPLYAATRVAADTMNASQDPASINAVVVLTDGRNEYTDNDLTGLLRDLEASAQENGVRVFTIAYGPDADLETLQQISEASRAAAYDARNPATIDKVFANVLSNF